MHRLPHAPSTLPHSNYEALCVLASFCPEKRGINRKTKSCTRISVISVYGESSTISVTNLRFRGATKCTVIKKFLELIATKIAINFAKVCVIYNWHN